ncbi:MAG: nickel pincer cofactor biosynthesis protein LarB [Bacillota bacterium]|jgi:NCAIR mutase (PurE)-related protein
MKNEQILYILQQVAAGKLQPQQALQNFKYFSSEDLGYANIDYHRELRKGFPEVVYAGGKTPQQILSIMTALQQNCDNNILATRCEEEVWHLLCDELPEADYYPQAKLICIEQKEPEEVGNILVVCAGTSDMFVAEEAALTAYFMGNKVERLYDVGVAGIHRLLNATEQLSAAKVIIVVAGMEGALPSVVAGLVDKPVIAVPTSVGYGTSFNGLAALLGMLNSCSSGITVVNIDNGFGAGYAASLINKMPY